MINKKDLTDSDICTKFITPAVEQAGWNVTAPVREQVCSMKARILWRGNRDLPGPSTANALDHCAGNAAEAARLLDVHKGTIYGLMEELETIDTHGGIEVA